MENPFEEIVIRLERIEKLIKQLKPEKIEGDLVFNIKEAAKFTNLSESRIYKYTWERLIPHYKKGKRLYFKKTELAEWLTANKVITKADIEKEAINYIIRNPRRY